jgi:hypothetical protein
VKDWGGYHAPYLALAMLCVVCAVAGGAALIRHHNQHTSGVLVCSFDGRETLRVRIVEGWRFHHGDGLGFTPYGGRFKTYWPVGGEVCAIERGATP